MDKFCIKTDMLYITAGNDNKILQVKNIQTGNEYDLSAPVYEIDHETSGRSLRFSGCIGEEKLSNKGTELILRYDFDSRNDIYLLVYVRYFPKTPIIRYRYAVCAE